jgi:hypothetical protein
MRVSTFYVGIFHSPFTHLSRSLGCGMPEVADSLAPVFTAIDAIVLYFQSTVIFPSCLGGHRKSGHRGSLQNRP